MPYTRTMSLVLFILFLPWLAEAAADASGLKREEEGSVRLAVFSWQKNHSTDETLRDEMFEVLAGIGANEVYQNLDDEAASSFIRQAYDRGIDVYLLSGQPEWGLDREAGRMRREVRRAARLREESGGLGPAGLVLDVEPYLTSSYERNPQRAMDRFAEAMRNTYAYAQSKGVPLIICIPYFYDSKGFEKVLEELIEEGSDAVAVMNYQKKDEAGKIQTEVAVSARADKRIIHIFELQRPGLYDLTERNTYFVDGLPAVWSSLHQLYAHFDYEGLSFALHDYTALREMINNE